MLFRVAAGLFALALTLSAQSGLVRDAAGGEPLARVKIKRICGETAAELTTDAAGRFRFEDPAPNCQLHLTLVGYRPLRAEASAAEMELILTPDTLRRRDAVDVAAGPFELTTASSPSERSLSAAEMKNLAGVLVDDPLRAVQALPGVASSNDFVAQFSVRAAQFRRVAVVLDGLTMHSPFHTVQGQEETGSLSIVQSDQVEEMTLFPGAPPASYMDRTAAALDIRLREGNRQAPTLRLNTGVASTSLIAEGPLDRAQRGSYLVSVRKSYLQYLLRRVSATDSMAFGYFDLQGKLSYDLSPKSALSLTVIDGHSDLDRSHAQSTLGLNSIMTAGYHVSAATLAYRFAPTSKVMFTQRASWMRERSDDASPNNLTLARQGYGEWVSNNSLVWNWAPNAPLEIGSSLRRVRDEGFSARYNFNPTSLRRRDDWRGNALRGGGHFQQSYTAGPLTLTAGARLDGYSESGPTSFSPHAGAVYALRKSTRLQLAFSQSVQYAELMPLTITNVGNPRLLPERANHATAALEQRLGDRTRLRFEVFQRSDRDLLAQPLLEPRLLANGKVFNPPTFARWENSVRGRARGFEVFLQRRTANRLSGWVSYGYTKSDLRDGITGARYAAEWEQRHTLNVYSSYRLRPSVNLSARYTYGSNFPIPGFFRLAGSSYFLSQERDALRLPAYHRADLRINKSFEGRSAQGWSWRGVFYAEIANLTNHENSTYDSFGGYNASTGAANPRFLKMFPIVPAAGLMLEWEAPRKPRR